MIMCLFDFFLITQAQDAVDTLAKAMYDRLFKWVYTRINKSIAADSATIKAVIGVLDIYGLFFRFNCLFFKSHRQRLFIYFFVFLWVDSS